MKKLSVMAAAVMALTLMVWAGTPTQTGTGKWFDMENCDFCKHLLKDPKLIGNMSWEYHDVSNGMLSIINVKPEFKQSYLEAQEAMKGLGDKLVSGELSFEDVNMCGHCQGWGKLDQLGAKFERIEAKTVEILLVTSEKPEVAKQIHEFAQRNRDELAKMKAEKTTD